MQNDIVPAYQFTIPSIPDGLTLNCRIYHPSSFNYLDHSEHSERRRSEDDDLTATETAPARRKPAWRKKGAIIAHPYAPLGGCQDDPVVMAVVEQFLDLDFVVGTFNFRYVCLDFFL